MLVLTELARTGPAARTAQDVHAALRQQGALLPFSTTYRVFLALADKGLIVPAAEDAGRPAFRLNTELMLQVARPNL
jgi:Fe2+ or Zn2+ uptake regulation protein